MLLGWLGARERSGVPAAACRPLGIPLPRLLEAGRLEPTLSLLRALPQVLIAHTVHEATHGNLHVDPRVNFWAQFASHPICFNVLVGIPQRLLSH